MSKGKCDFAIYDPFNLDVLIADLAKRVVNLAANQ